MDWINSILGLGGTTAAPVPPTVTSTTITNPYDHYQYPTLAPYPPYGGGEKGAAPAVHISHPLLGPPSRGQDTKGAETRGQNRPIYSIADRAVGKKAGGGKNKSATSPGDDVPKKGPDRPVYRKGDDDRRDSNRGAGLTYGPLGRGASPDWGVLGANRAGKPVRTGWVLKRATRLEERPKKAGDRTGRKFDM